MTKDICPYLARKYKTATLNIEHNINVCWKANRNGMAEIAGVPLIYKLPNSELMDMVAYYLLSCK
ncbi:MAG: sporulation initiation factor Spo0A C-terminal domain-containing protein [Butyricicoccaceae bacterium]